MNGKLIKEYFKGNLGSRKELEIQMQMADMSTDKELLELLDSEFEDLTPEPDLDIRRPLASIKNQLGFRNTHRILMGAIRICVCICAFACIPLSILLVMKTSPS